jgi:hypothetical protein
MLRPFVLTTAFLLTAATVASAQLPKQPPPVAGSPLGQGDARERAACHPDVVRYCKELIKDDANSDVFAILGCLQTNRQRISKACNAVLASHGQ